MIMSLNKKQYILLLIGMALMIFSSFLPRFLDVSDLVEGTVKGIGIGVMISSLLIKKKVIS